MLTKIRHTVTVAAVFGTLLGSAAAQVLLDTIVRPLPPTASTSAFGQCLIDVGDQDGDGVADLAATEPLAISGMPEITIYSGSTRLPIRVIPIATTNNFEARALRTDGDFNGDGRGDLVVRLGGLASDSARIFDPLSGTQLWMSTAKERVTPIVDATGDGRMDLASAGKNSILCLFSSIVGFGETTFFNVQSVAPNPALTVYSQSLTANCSPGTSSNVPISLGTHFCGIRDANGDGRTDFVVSHTGTTSSFANPPIAPVVKIFLSSVSAAGVTSYVDTATFIVSDVLDIVRMSDMTGDGEPEVCVVNSSGNFAAPALTLTFYSSQSATVFRTLTLSVPTFLRPHVISVGDVDKDGVGDFAIEFNQAGTIKVQVFSGATATVLFDIVPPGAPLSAPNGATFESIAWLGDTDGDGSEELAVARNLTREIFIYSLRHSGVTYFGQGCGPTSAPEIGIGGNFLPNGTVRYNFASAVPNSLGILLLGTSNQFWGSTPLPFDLTPIGLAGCNLLVAPDLLEYVYADAIGAGGYSYPLPPAGVITGFTLFGQWFFEHPLGAPTDFGVSNGVEVVFP